MDFFSQEESTFLREEKAFFDVSRNIKIPKMGINMTVKKIFCLSLTQYSLPIFQGNG